MSAAQTRDSEFVADVVVPVHGGLHHVRHCLSGLARTTDGARVIVVDDSSPPYEARRLRELVEELEAPTTRFELVRNDENLGYLQSVTRGIELGSAPWVVTLNSDTIPTPGWLDGLISALGADDRHGIACPLSNHANLTRFDFPWGATFLEVAEEVRRHSERRYPEIGLASGFCLVTSRRLLEELGGFDEAYDPGYFEETDLCMRAMERGYRVVADDATFIFHHGWASFGVDQRTALMERNARIFESRWGDAHQTWQQRIENDQPFAPLEQTVRDALGSKHSAQSAGPRWSIERARSRDDGTHPHPRFSDVTTDTDEIRVTRRRTEGSAAILMPAIDADRSTVATLRLASELCLAGTDIQVATSGPVNAGAFSDPVVLRPHVFDEVNELVEELPAVDVVIATSVDTLLPALALRERDGCAVASMLGEPTGRPPAVSSDLRAWTGARALGGVDHHLVRGRTFPASSRLGPHRHHVPFGVDLDVYYPASEVPTKPHVVVPVSGRTRLAEWETVIASLTLLTDRLPDVNVTFAGMSQLSAPTHARVLGHLTMPEEAELLRGASVVVDPSGSVPAIRSRLRTFAVGIPLVVPEGPDPTEITLPDHNCVTFTPGDPTELAQTIADIVKDPLRYSGMAAAGLATAHRFDLRREIEAARLAFTRILELSQEAASPSEERERWTSQEEPVSTPERLELAKTIVMSRHDVLEELQAAKAELERAERKLDEVYDSETWRVGEAILRAPKAIRGLIERFRRDPG